MDPLLVVARKDPRGSIAPGRLLDFCSTTDHTDCSARVNDVARRVAARSTRQLFSNGISVRHSCARKTVKLDCNPGQCQEPPHRSGLHVRFQESYIFWAKALRCCRRILHVRVAVQPPDTHARMYVRMYVRTCMYLQVRLALPNLRGPYTAHGFLLLPLLLDTFLGV